MKVDGTKVTTVQPGDKQAIGASAGGTATAAPLPKDLPAQGGDGKTTNGSGRDHFGDKRCSGQEANGAVVVPFQS